MDNFPYLWKGTDFKTQEEQRTPIRFNKSQPSKGRKLQGKTDQVCSSPIHRKLAGQKGGARNIQCAESEKYADKIPNPARLSFKIKGD